MKSMRVYLSRALSNAKICWSNCSKLPAVCSDQWCRSEEREARMQRKDVDEEVKGNDKRCSVEDQQRR
ncbi:hypothetical protein PHSY_006045 [Pseudozyma hubeiensis SY62]|uniref:Uncharacterized protein n=1 Tax=Pseudozyma hubeiensis (strain SY62) TaxID=1305764 RepID=R9PAQ5_PSEHS|nr:hypothetical protein PHSY_006045 [Pseudozyma hubeiensis SY62]GAC98451.1 hypothetical protein PHSY_006045 [Pseudozyma hubeiensis SY62]